MDLLNRKKTGKVERPVKVLQFGEGNFLRAFVDYMIDIANEQGKFNRLSSEVLTDFTIRSASIQYS